MEMVLTMPKKTKPNRLYVFENNAPLDLVAWLDEYRSRFGATRKSAILQILRFFMQEDQERQERQQKKKAIEASRLESGA